MRPIAPLGPQVVAREIEAIRRQQLLGPLVGDLDPLELEKEQLRLNRRAALADHLDEGAIGGILGAIVGLFFGLIGIFVGPLVGALIGELLGGKGLLPAGRSSWGTLIGTTAGIIGKFSIGLLMIIWFLVAAFVA